MGLYLVFHLFVQLYLILCLTPNTFKCTHVSGPGLYFFHFRLSSSFPDFNTLKSAQGKKKPDSDSDEEDLDDLVDQLPKDFKEYQKKLKF